MRNGIVKHSKGRGAILPETKAERANTLEGQIVRAADIIAYVNHDLDDAMRAEVVKKSDIPLKILKVLGDTHSKRIDTMVKDLIYCSLETDLEKLKMGEDILSVIYMLREFLYDQVYEGKKLINEFKKAKRVLQDLYAYYLEHIEEVFADIPKEKKIDRHRLVCDFIAGMTDRFALMTYERLFFPQQWEVL